MKLTENSVLNVMQTASELYMHLYSLNAIWLEDKLVVVRSGMKTNTNRMALTDNVKVENGIIVNALDGNDATHEIVKLRGTNRTDNNEFEISGRNLSTDEIELIKLP